MKVVSLVIWTSDPEQAVCLFFTLFVYKLNSTTFVYSSLFLTLSLFNLF